MSAVEGLLKMLTETSARGLRLSVGSPAKMIDAAGAPRDASSNPMTRQEILQIIGPIIPEHARRRLPQETSVEFDHASPNGAFKVTILRNGQEIAVSIVPDSSAASAAPVAPAALAEPVAPAAPVAPAPSVGGPPIDRLFRLMVDSKASDLHLSSGMPAMIRKDGKIQPLEEGAAPISPAEMIALLDPIMPATNAEEFSRRNDTAPAPPLPERT